MKLSSNLQHCENKISLLALVFRKLFTPKEVVLKRLKGLSSEHLAGINMFTGFKHC